MLPYSEASAKVSGISTAIHTLFQRACSVSASTVVCKIGVSFFLASARYFPSLGAVEEPVPVRARTSIAIEFSNHILPEASPTGQICTTSRHTDIRHFLEKNMELCGLVSLLFSVCSYMTRSPWFYILGTRTKTCTVSVRNGDIFVDHIFCPTKRCADKMMCNWL